MARLKLETDRWRERQCFLRVSPNLCWRSHTQLTAHAHPWLGDTICAHRLSLGVLERTECMLGRQKVAVMCATTTADMLLKKHRCHAMAAVRMETYLSYA